MTRASSSRGRVRLRAWWPLLLVLIVGCASEQQADPPADQGGTSDLTSDLLAGRRDGPGGSGVPLTDGGAPGVTEAPPEGGPVADEVGGTSPAVENIETLGFDAGAESAPVRVIEFSDFGCAFCRQFHLETYPTIEEEYIATGKVEWKYVPIVIGRFGPSAELAAEAGECAGEQGRFAAVRDRIFQLQREWQQSPDPLSILRAIATEARLDVGRWDQCVLEGWRVDRVRAGTQLGFQAGVEGTPTFFIVGFAAVPGAIPIDVFREVLDSALVQSQGQGPGR